MIFSFDFVYYRYNKANCYYLAIVNIKFYLNRVIAIEKDYINIIALSEIIKLIINLLYPISRFKVNKKNFPISTLFTAIELFLSKNEFYNISKVQINFLEIDIYYNYRYKKPNISLDNRPAIYKTRFIIRNIYNIQIKLTNTL